MLYKLQPACVPELNFDKDHLFAFHCGVFSQKSLNSSVIIIIILFVSPSWYFCLTVKLVAVAGGLSTTAMVRIQITDVNDNEPIFNPVEYNLSLRDDVQTTTPFAVVQATDRDSERFGTVSYKIVPGKDANLFRVDRSTGEVFLSRGNFLSRSSSYHINVSAMDGGGNKASQDAQVAINIINSHMPMPVFQQSSYAFVIPEDVFKNSVVGTIKASTLDGGKLPTCNTFHMNIDLGPFFFNRYWISSG